MRPLHSRRRIIPALLAGALTLTAAGCSGNANPTAIPSSSVSRPTPTTSSPSPDASAWQDKFTAAQIEAYNEALQRWTSAETRLAPIWAAGKATPEAKALFKEYFAKPDIQFYELETYEQNGLAVEGTARVLWSKPEKIYSNGSRVVIQQCIDPRTITTTQNGKALNPTQKPVVNGPYIRTITLEPFGDEGVLLVVEVLDVTNTKKVATCS